jgi:hypothetical protein
MSSPIDRFPTTILKSCAGVFTPLKARLAKLCFGGVSSAIFKLASVTPSLKKKGLDCDDVASYRSISNLHTSNHSTETALLRMVNDAYCTADNKSRILLVQLDLSAVFDPIDHSTLLRGLKCSFGLSGSVIR